jgi:glyoxylase-like metal-dependent hydrolase (beta-lactamase superfamily II)/ferredoxin
MGRKSLTNQHNQSGEFFVDTRCIGCGACTYVAPNIFVLYDSKAIVFQQPSHPDSIQDALIALHSCPVFSIGTHTLSTNVTLPCLIDDNVYFCGYNAESSFGASSYLIRRNQGNILVDSPRFDKRLVRILEEMGGLAYIYLTHQDDIADYKKFQKHFNAKVIFHRDDFNSKITQADIILEGEEEYVLDDEVRIIIQRGHTKGHTVLLYKNHFLFSGDHLAYNLNNETLYAFKDYCWFDWPTQLRSLERLNHYTFSHLLPAHGAPYESDANIMKEKLYHYLQGEKK